MTADNPNESTAPCPSRTRFPTALWSLLALALCLGSACTPRSAQSELAGSGGRDRLPQAALNKPHNASVSCKECHQDHYGRWFDSHHAKAHRELVPGFDAQYLRKEGPFREQGVEYRMSLIDGRLAVGERQAGYPDYNYTASFVLGHTPLRQLIVETEPGRYQAASLALDPQKREWFEVFGSEGRKPDEWGHWRGRGMNWNSMCAHCHMTAFDRGYDPGNDSYRSTWLEHGVGCVQCHGPTEKEHLQKGYRTTHRATPPLHSSPVRMMETCAPCHARNELLNKGLTPGANYHDGQRLSLPLDLGTFYADGQQRDEDFNYSSFLLSRMGGKGGVTCLDCHDPHTLKTKLPASNNALCMQCHSAPGRQGAPVIEPLRHSGHKADSEGNQCVACHMPTTTYMQRDPRHDHGFIIPDPLLTRELGIPNSCTRCHQDKGLDWEIAGMQRLYGEQTGQRHKRERTRAVDAAHQGRGDPERLLRLLSDEPIPAWRATLLQLAGRSSAVPGDALLRAARTAVTAVDPLERSAAAQVLPLFPREQAMLIPLLRDPTLLVRLDAGMALGGGLPAGSGVGKELKEYIEGHLDQPAGRARSAQLHFLAGERDKALEELSIATRWDSKSADLWNLYSRVQQQCGKIHEAAQSLENAAALQPLNAEQSFASALLWAEAGDMERCKKGLEETLRREPAHHRAWYNLGLLLQQAGRRAEALAALEKAEYLAPREADYPYALAVLHLQEGKSDKARAAVERTLGIDPRHRASQLLGTTR